MSPHSFRRAARGMCSALLLAMPACAHDWSSSQDPAKDQDASTADVGVDQEDAGDAEDASADGAAPQPDGSDAATGAGLDAQATGNDASQDATTADGANLDPEAGSDASASGADAQVDAGPACFADNDKDGVGAGPAVSCEEYGTDAGSALSLSNTDCDDNNNKRSPSLTDVCGDNVDNDCDGAPDDEANNACGGPCTVQLAHKPGDKCSNGLLGACAREGTWQCSGTSAVVCSAPTVQAADERCGDNVDNDCDGASDESDAVDAVTWYPDCDADGYAASPCLDANLQPIQGCDVATALQLSSRRACRAPAPPPSCKAWAVKFPVAKTTHDCDDTSDAYRPGNADFALMPNGRSNGDLNCDGIVEKLDRIATSYNPDARTWTTYAICTGSCASCYASYNSLGMRWAQGASVPCSTEATGSAWESAVEFTLTSATTCPNGGYARMPNPAWQLCR